MFSVTLQMTQNSKRPAAWLIWFLRGIGLISQLAFVAAIMPESWIVEITDALKLDPFPETPIAFYLARHLSLLYGFIGIGLIVISYQLTRYRELVGYLATGIIVFGVLQGWIDFQSGLPHWWSLGEAAGSITGGLIMTWLHRNCEYAKS